MELFIDFYFERNFKIQNMEWWEVIGLTVAWVVGFYLRGWIYEERNGYKLNDSWKGRRE